MLDHGGRSQLTPPVSDQRDHVRGPANAPVTLCEFGDFECPHCGQAHVILNALMERAGDEILFAFRHFPLAEAHPHANGAAEAAEAAGTQGRFWPMHDVLFEHQDALDDESLVGYAAELALDLARFQQELLDRVHTARVRADFLNGVRSGVNGTPTFFINGRRHDGPWDLDSLAAAIDAEMQRRPHGHPGGRHEGHGGWAPR